MNPKQLTSSLYCVAIGFGILSFNINLGRINILPDWLGYWLILKSLDDIAVEEPSAALLKPLGKLLMLWHIGVWFLQLAGSNVDGGFIVYVVAVEQLYFQFQLLTNLAAIAANYVPQYERRILQLRTVMTLVVTGYTLVSAVIQSEAVMVLAAAVQLAAALWLFRTLLHMEEAMTELFGLKQETTPTFAERIQMNNEPPKD